MLNAIAMEAPMVHGVLAGSAPVSAAVPGPGPYVMGGAKLAELQANLGRMDQSGIDRALIVAAKSGHQVIVELLLNRQDGQLRPDQIGINQALSGAASNDHQAIVELLLNRQDGQLRPNQVGINLALMGAAINGLQATVEYLLNRPAGQLSPDRAGINGVLSGAASNGHQSILEYFLSRPAEQRPTQEGIIDAYREAIAQHRVAIIAILEALPAWLLPRAIIQEQRLTANLGIGHGSYVMGGAEKAKLAELQAKIDSMDQNLINESLSGAVENGYQAIFELLLNRPEGRLRPDQQGINKALSGAVRHRHQVFVEWLLNLPAGQIGPNQIGINDALNTAAEIGERAIVEWLLNLPAGQIRPDQDGVNGALSGAASNGHQAIVEWLLNRPEGQIRPDQIGIIAAYRNAVAQRSVAIIARLEKLPAGLLPRAIIEEQRLAAELQANLGRMDQNQINESLMGAAENGYQAIVEWLLNLPAGQLRPDQPVINQALISAARQGHQVLVEWLLNRPAGQLRPDQEGINWALFEAIDHIEIFELLLNRPARQIRPDQVGIIAAYRQAVAQHRVAIIERLEALPADLLPRAIIQEQRPVAAAGNQPVRGAAFEVHDFADARVQTSGVATSSSASSAAASNPPGAPKEMKLIDAVFENIESRLNGIKLISYTNVRNIIDAAINSIIPPDQQDLAKQAAVYHLRSDGAYEKDLCLVVSFIQKFHSDKMQLWIGGFVTESIQAYQNSRNPTSCTKGIRERVATGLRGIDPELDKLFAQAEGPMLFKNWLKTWDLHDIKGGTEKELAKQLKAKGINGKSGVDEVVVAFRAIAIEQLKTNGLENNQVLQKDVEVYAESMIGENYETVLKPAVAAMDNVGSAAEKSKVAPEKNGKDEA